MNILIIDDEPAILRSIRRMLRSELGKHQLDLVDDPYKATELIKNKYYDLVISDMRMPGKDGCQVLAEVARYSPQSIRAILSGYSDKKQSVKAAEHAHLYLVKPFKQSTITDLLRRADALNSMPLSDHLRAALGKLNALAPVPKLFLTLTDTLNNPQDRSTSKDIADILMQDMAMAAKVLQLTNSAFFGGSSPIQDLHKAVTLLGTEIIKGLVLHQHLFELSEDQPGLQQWREQLMLKNQRTAQLSRLIGVHQKAPREQLESIALAGLLQDIGRLALIQQPGASVYADQLCTELTGLSLCQKEEQLFGTHHGWTGAYLLKLWGFLDPVVDAVALHHHPLQSGHNHFTPLTAVHAASALLDDSAEVDEEYLEKVNCLHALDDWKALAQTV
jgi:HD-like signal output (HDOD) protein